MSIKKTIRAAYLSFPRNLQQLESFRFRCKGCEGDYHKGKKRATSLSNIQKEKIKRFWEPYLHDWKTKYAFDMKWFEIYNTTNVFGFKIEHYIPDSFYYSIVDKSLSNAIDAKVFDDKNLYDLYFHDVKQPKTIVRKIRGVYMDRLYHIISKDAAIEKCIENKSVIIKPSIDALAGHGIVFWKGNQDSKDVLEKGLESGENLIVQDIIRQHEFMNKFTMSCVNTMRIVTLLWENDVIITTAVLIMGGPTAKTNHLHGGGIVCGILPDGSLRDTAFDGQLNAYKEHPNGMKFSEITIPNYDKCVALVKELSPRLAGISKFLNWDITLDEFGDPLLIEVNITEGGSVQIAGGPAFGEKTKEVLDYVTKHGVWK